MTARQLLEHALRRLSETEIQEMARIVPLEFLAKGRWCRYVSGEVRDVETGDRVRVGAGDTTIVRLISPAAEPAAEPAKLTSL